VIINCIIATNFDIDKESPTNFNRY